MAATTVGVKLDEETRNKLKRLGESKQRSSHWMIKEAIARYLDDEERYEREKAEDMARWQQYLDTGEAISHQDAKARLKELADKATRQATDE